MSTAPYDSQPNYEDISKIVEKYRTNFLNQELPLAIRAFQCLTEVITCSNGMSLPQPPAHHTAGSSMALNEDLDLASALLRQGDSNLSLQSGCDLFVRFVTHPPPELSVCVYTLYDGSQLGFFQMQGNNTK